MKFKNYVLSFILFLFINYLCYSQTQCWPLGWSKNLTEETYTYWITWPNPDVFATMFVETDYNYIKDKISGYVFSAFNQWASPALITITQATSYDAADFKVGFTELAGRGGYYNNFVLNFCTVSRFSFDEYYCPNDRYNFLTVALHEVGHAIFGGQLHNDADDSSATHQTDHGRLVEKLSTCDKLAVDAIYNPPYTVTYNNNFGVAVNSSQIKVNGVPKTITSAGGSETWQPSDGDKTLEAIDQGINDRYRLFDNWNNDEYGTKEIDLPKSTKTYTAYFKKRFDIRFYDGSVVISGNTYQSGQVYYHKEDDIFYTTANPKTENGLYCIFASWKEGTSTYSTSNPGTFSPNGDTDYTIEYSVVKPVWTNRNLHTNSTPGAYITVYWNDHPCSDVSYKIYRKIKHDGVIGSEVLRATVSHGTTN